MEEQFTVQGRLVSPLTITFGKDPQAFRGSISISGRKRPVRHLVAISGELAQTHLSDDREYGRSIVSDSDPVFILYRLATRFGLPVLPEWGSWFVSELKHKHKIQPLLGIGCSPVVVYGTKQTFMHWISLALKKKRIFVPAENTSVSWEIPDHFIPF